MSIRAFMSEHYRHFNAATVREATESLVGFLGEGNKLMITLAGAMSTAELGRSLAGLIRAGKVDAICCTGANLEEDVFYLVAADHYERIPNWRELTPGQEAELAARGLNRVTDTCIPEEEAFRRVERQVLTRWQAADAAGERKFPHAFLYDMLRDGDLAGVYQNDPERSWLVAAAERDLPLYVPGWEDSTLGNVFAARVADGKIARSTTVLGGIDYLIELASWYRQASADASVGFFQIGGGIAGDFPICVVPMIHQDLQEEVPLWGWFCQISDSTTSYGSYSGAVPNEKITWGKLGPRTPRFIIESDATIVAPLIFTALLEA